MYSASSSLRAWTLRLPSLVLSSALSSLNVRLSRTASALTIASRTRSPISRSRSAVFTFGFTGRSGSARAIRAVLLLATVPPCDDQAEHDVKAAETACEEPRLPTRRYEQRRRAQDHETNSHHRDNPH